MTIWIGALRLSIVPISALTIGYLWIAGSWFFEFQVPSSGAVLLSMCVIAELSLNSLAWIRASFPNLPFVACGHHKAEDGIDLFSFYQDFAVVRLNPATRKPPADIILGTNHSIHHSLQIMFDYSGDNFATTLGALNTKNFDLMQRSFQFRIQVLIAVSAIMGSVLWGYGHIVFQAN